MNEQELIDYICYKHNTSPKNFRVYLEEAIKLNFQSLTKQNSELRSIADCPDIFKANERIKELEDEITDYKDTFKTIMDEKCHDDEIHCTCVPYLRKEVKKLEKSFAGSEVYCKHLEDELRNFKNQLTLSVELLDKTELDVQDEVSKRTAFEDVIADMGQAFSKVQNEVLLECRKAEGECKQLRENLKSLESSLDEVKIELRAMKEVNVILRDEGPKMRNALAEAKKEIDRLQLKCLLRLEEWNKANKIIIEGQDKLKSLDKWKAVVEKMASTLRWTKNYAYNSCHSQLKDECEERLADFEALKEEKK